MYLITTLPKPFPESSSLAADNQFVLLPQLDEATLSPPSPPPDGDPAHHLTMLPRVGILKFEDRNRYGPNGIPSSVLFGGGRTMTEEEVFKTWIGHIIPLVIPAALIIPRVDFTQFQ